MNLAWLGRLALCAAAVTSTGCAPEIGGRASFPILSEGSLPPTFEPVTKVDEKRCGHQVLFFWAWGDDPNHEALVTDILTKHKGDAIANAELTYFTIPAVLYNQGCARVRGTVVRRTAVATTTKSEVKP